jgi:hypothetical protein
MFGVSVNFGWPNSRWAATVRRQVRFWQGRRFDLGRSGEKKPQQRTRQFAVPWRDENSAWNKPDKQSPVLA